MRLNTNRNPNSNPKGDRKIQQHPKTLGLFFIVMYGFKSYFSQKFCELFLFVNGLFIVLQCSNSDVILDGNLVTHMKLYIF